MSSFWLNVFGTCFLITFTLAVGCFVSAAVVFALDRLGRWWDKWNDW